MKVLKDPFADNSGMNYLPYLTDESEIIINSAREKIEPLVNESRSDYTIYFEVRGEEVYGEHNCCDNPKCIDRSKANIREEYGKGSHVKDIWSLNDGDHEEIGRCCICNKPLNEYLTWCEQEIEHLDQFKPQNKDFLKENSFLIYCILTSTPTMDCEISRYSMNMGGQVLDEALEIRELFFKRILDLAQTILDEDFNGE